MNNSEKPVVVIGYKKNSTVEPVVVKKREKNQDTPVFVEYLKKKEGIHFNNEAVKVSNVIMNSMAKEIKAYINSKGYDIDIYQIYELIASMSSHTIVMPYTTTNIRLASLLSDYFSGDRYNAANKTSFYKAIYSAAFYPNIIRVLSIAHTSKMPDSLVEYIKNPYVSVKFNIDEYINDKYISQIKVKDNVFVFILGDYKEMQDDLKGYYSLWNPELITIERKETEYQRISYDAILNIHKSLNYKDSELWQKVDIIDKAIEEAGIELSNEVLNGMDDYLAFLSSLTNDNRVLASYIRNKLKPILNKELLDKIVKLLSIREEI